MNIEAVGAYLQRLRQKKEMSRIQLATLVGTTETSLWRIESGKQEPRGPLLFALVNAVGGRIEDVQKLLLDETATKDDADQLANQAFSQSSNPQEQEEQHRLTYQQLQEKIEQVIRILPDHLLDDLINIVEAMHTDPRLTWFFLGYLVACRDIREERKRETAG
jgi:transcriptional regulator with XRE-family HTH domain